MIQDPDEQSKQEPVYTFAYDYYLSQHDHLSLPFTELTQGYVEEGLDLRAFIDACATEVIPDEKHSYAPGDVYPLGFYMVEPISRIRYADLIFKFTMFERRVRRLCKLIHEKDPVPGLTLADYRGELTGRLKQFLRDRLGFEVGTVAEWSTVITLQKVRDCIIHCGGFIDESRDKDWLEDLGTRDRGLDITRSGYIRLEHRFCDEMEQGVAKFLFDLFDHAHVLLRARIIAKQESDAAAGSDLPAQ